MTFHMSTFIFNTKVGWNSQIVIIICANVVHARFIRQLQFLYRSDAQHAYCTLFAFI